MGTEICTLNVCIRDLYFKTSASGICTLNVCIRDLYFTMSTEVLRRQQEEEAVTEGLYRQKSHDNLKNHHLFHYCFYPIYDHTFHPLP
jgi:hypothetical protein